MPAPSPVSGSLPGRAAMREPAQDLEAHLDGAMRGTALQVDDEAETARVVLVARVVETIRARTPGRRRAEGGIGSYL